MNVKMEEIEAIETLLKAQGDGVNQPLADAENASGPSAAEIMT